MDISKWFREVIMSEGGQEADGNVRTMVIHYQTLRFLIGILGFLLPFVLAVGAAILDLSEIRESVSDYYYTSMRNVFVGILCIIAFMLFSYEGYAHEDERVSDNAAGNLGCLFALGVAWAPVAYCSSIVRFIHVASATLLLLTFAYFSLCLFTRGKDEQKNRVYKTCGAVIILMIALIALYEVYALYLNGEVLRAWKPVFWLESFAVMAFGLSWLIKADTTSLVKSYFRDKSVKSGAG